MAQVTVKINGYAYTVGCEDGQEPHLLAMATEVENRIDSIKAIGGNTGESRLLVLSALLMADELHDMRIEMGNLRALAANNAKSDTKPAGKSQAELARKLNRMVGRAEQIAANLEHS